MLIIMVFEINFTINIFDLYMFVNVCCSLICLVYITFFLLKTEI